MVDDILPLMCSPPSTFDERRMDPMLFEAFLIGHRPGTKEGTSTPSCVGNRHPSTKEIHSPLLLRSEAEQLVDEELIKALSDFKQQAVAPSSPQTQHHNPVVKVSDVKCPVDTQSLSHHQKTKLKCQKPVVKVVRDMLTKKWIFVKKNKQLRALSPCLSNLRPPIEMNWTVERKDRQLRDVIQMAMLLETLGIPV
jgi:hypothetical protein